MGNIRQMNLIGTDKRILHKSVINHLDDLLDYMDNYDTLKDTKKIMSKELAEKRAKCTLYILNNIEVLF